MIYFTSDTHFGHYNILKYCNRPWKEIYHHDNQLIKNWNSVVNPDDRVYHLGDFGFKSKSVNKEIAEQLNGIKFILHGNHDKKKHTDRTI
jgi:calcineurin-like phosphoesterase family protein